MKTATTLLTETFERLQLGDGGGFPVKRLEYDEGRRMVIVEIDKKGIALIPLENVAGMVPLGKGEEKDYQITPADARQKQAIKLAQEEQARREAAAKAKVDAQKQRALEATQSAQRSRDSLAEAERIRAEYKKNHPQETTPFPAGYEPPPVATKLGMRLGETPEEPEAILPVDEYEQHEKEMFEHQIKMPEMKSKPKKRKTRKDKGKPRKKREATT